ncbi:DUF2853 family protein [Sulfurovum riftiae]|uniref:DUF2853 family protein n=1 Tax=Sulfurovum riftiae TaxID=1630136 RepID=UPI001F4DEF5F|nr:DUF2853 family protein [Sulfurovum riftiae]
MSDIAIVKLIKDMFGKLFGSEEKNEKTTLVSEAKNSSETEKPEAVKKEPVKKKTAAKKKKSTAAEKKSAVKKKEATAEKKTVTKKSSKKPKSSTATAAKGTKKAEKIALYTKAFKKQYGEVDTDFLEIIVKNLGPSIYRKDAELVSCSDPKELDTVRKNFLIKKLGLQENQEVLDAAIKEVCEELKDTSKKYRALFYYRLAQKFKKESVLS